MTVIIVAEQDRIAKAISPFARKHWPHEQIVILSAVPYGLNYRFEYPRGLAWSDYPVVATPHIRVAEVGASWRPSQVDEQGSLVPCDVTANLFETASLVVCACDPDHTGAMMFALLMEHVFGRDILASRTFPSLRLTAIDDCSLEQAFAEMTDFKVSFGVQLAYGCVKRYFDWNWNANALAILGVTARAAGVPANAPPISKYALQLLFWLADHSGTHTEAQVISRMSHWEGSGKYGTSVQLGSPSSYSKILEILFSNGLIDHQASIDSPMTLTVTDRGRAYLALLHKDCQDADLPFRLEFWCEQGLEKAKPAIDRYIKTFFGKQKRFK